MAMSTSVKVNWFSLLPRELRDQIIELVFLAEIEPPELPQDQDRRREEKQGGGSIYYEHPPPLTNLQGLLGCSRQLRQESLEFMDRYGASNGSAFQYKLDLAIWGCSLQPTWLFLPVPPKYISQITVQLRMFNHSFLLEVDRVGANEEDRYGILPQYLLQMLRRFLHHGPSFATNPPGRRNTRPLYPLHIDRLQIEFASMTTELVEVDGKMKLAPLLPSWPSPSLDEFTSVEILSQDIRKIARIGILHGSIDEVGVKYRNFVQVWRVPDSRDKALAAKVLSPYGWGPVLKITQKAVDKGDIAYSEALDCRPPSSEFDMEMTRQSIPNYEEYGRGWKSRWD